MIAKAIIRHTAAFALPKIGKATKYCGDFSPRLLARLQKAIPGTNGSHLLVCMEAYPDQRTL